MNMSTILGKEVRITNSKLIRFASEYKINLGDLEQLNAGQVIDLVAYCSDVTIEELEAEIDKDLGFIEQLSKVVVESLEIKGGDVEKPKAKPLKRK